MEKIIEIIKDSFVYKMLNSKRFKSLYWRLGAQVVVAFLAEIQSYMTNWSPQAWQTIFVGLVVAEITKKLNSKK